MDAPKRRKDSLPAGPARRRRGVSLRSPDESWTIEINRGLGRTVGHANSDCLILPRVGLRGARGSGSRMCSADQQAARAAFTDATGHFEAGPGLEVEDHESYTLMG